MKNIITFALLAAWVCPAGAAELYKWQDAEGRVHYTDRSPPPAAKSIERKKAGGNFIESDTLPYETRQAAKKHPVTLYAFAECGAPCISAEALLDKRGVPYILKSSEEDKAAVQRLTGDNMMPVLVVGNQSPLKGFNEEAWNNLLDLAGYPKSNPLANLRQKKPPAPATGKTAAPAKEDGGAKP